MLCDLGVRRCSRQSNISETNFKAINKAKTDKVFQWKP